MNNMNNELAAALAHEIKNPISVIRANVDYIKLSVKPQYSKCFSIIDKELNKLTSLITDYTAILQPDTVKEMIFLEDLIYDVTDEFSILNNKKITFTFDLDSEISIKGDYKKLSILLFNIYKNSIEAITKEGKILTKLYKKDNSAIIEITDTGSGISSDIADKIGTPFLTTKENGSGLGLMICRTIAEAHNGTVTIENADIGCKTTLKFKNEGE